MGTGEIGVVLASAYFGLGWNTPALARVTIGCLGAVEGVGVNVGGGGVERAGTSGRADGDGLSDAGVAAAVDRSGDGAATRWDGADGDVPADEDGAGACGGGVAAPGDEDDADP